MWRTRMGVAIGVVVGAAGTLLIQWTLGPKTEAHVQSPDGNWTFVVERQTPWLGPANRTFRICESSTGRDSDGCILVMYDSELGFPDMTHMTTYWRGITAVADFRWARLERTMRADSHWEWKYLPETTQPTTRP